MRPIEVPGTVCAGGDRITVARAWPGKADPSRPTDRVITIEGRDEQRRLRAGRLRFAADAAMTVKALPAGTDPKLPALERHARSGELVVHRMGRRAVVRTRDGYLKALRMSKVDATREASARLGRLAADAGFAAPALLEQGPGYLRYSTVPGISLHELGQRPDADSDHSWRAAWDCWQARWPRLLAGRLEAARHGPEDEAAVLRTWVGHVLTAGLAGLDRAALIEAREQVTRLLSDIETSVWVPAHRDLHDKQLLVGPDGTLGLIDFDTAVLADPALDLGNLAVHLHWRHHQGLLSEERRDSGLAAISSVAEQLAIDPAVRHAYEASARLRLLCVYLFRPRWVDAVRRWDAVTTLGRSTRTQPIKGER